MLEIKKLFKHSSHYFMGSLLGTVTGFITLPILTRTFSVSQYGAFGLVTATIFMLVAIAKFGSQYSTVRYYDEYKTMGDEGLRKYYTTFLVQAVLFAIATAFIFFIINMFLGVVTGPYLKNLAWLVAILCITDSLIIRLNNFIRVEQKIKLFNLINIVNRYASMGVGLFFVFYISRNIFSFFIGQALVQLLIVISLMLFYKKRLDFKKVSLPLFKQSLSYGFPLLLLELSSLFFKFIDRYLIQSRLGLESVGIYTLGANLSQYLQDALFLPVSLAIFPLYMEIYNKGGKKKVELFLSKTVDHMLMLCIPIIFGIFLLSRDIIIILASNKFVASHNVIPYITTGAIIWGFYNIFAAGLYIHKKTKIIAFIIFTTGCLNIILNLFSIPIWGIMGSAISILLSYIIMTCLIIKTSCKYIKVEVNFLNVGKYLAASIIMFFIIHNIRIAHTHILFAILIKTFVGLIAYFIFLTLFDNRIKKIVGKISLNGFNIPLVLKNGLKIFNEV